MNARTNRKYTCMQDGRPNILTEFFDVDFHDLVS